jgi:hypothetical protein
MVVKVAGEKNQNEPGKKNSELPKKIVWGEKKGKKKKINYWPNKLSPVGQVHPIHEIPEQDVLDGAKVGAGSLKPATNAQFST